MSPSTTFFNGPEHFGYLLAAGAGAYFAPDETAFVVNDGTK